MSWMKRVIMQARLGEVNQPIKQEDHAHALMQRSYPEGSTSRRYTNSSPANVNCLLLYLLYAYQTVQTAVATRVDLPEQTRFLIYRWYVSVLCMLITCTLPICKTNLYRLHHVYFL